MHLEQFCENRYPLASLSDSPVDFRDLVGFHKENRGTRATNMFDTPLVSLVLVSNIK